MEEAGQHQLFRVLHRRLFIKLQTPANTYNSYILLLQENTRNRRFPSIDPYTIEEVGEKRGRRRRRKRGGQGYILW
jgi:hypothetical protein